MLIYLDNCCYNRPFDDQSQLLISLQTEAKLFIQQGIKEGAFKLVWSAILDIENDANPDMERRKVVRTWRSLAQQDVETTENVELLAEQYAKGGVKPMDALHVASAVLDKSRIPAEDFAERYHLRWGVEEDYKKIKQRMELETFSGYSVEAVLQDFYAKILSKNLTMLFVNEAQKQVDEKTAHRKRPYKVNFTRAVSRMKHQLVRLFMWPDLAQQLDRLISLIASSFEAVRPGRSFLRKKKRSGKFKRTR